MIKKGETSLVYLKNFNTFDKSILAAYSIIVKTKYLVDDIFAELETSANKEQVKDLVLRCQKIFSDYGVLWPEKHHESLGFKFRPNELDDLSTNDPKETYINLASKSKDPLIKALIAISWKNGLLEKLRPFFDGIRSNGTIDKSSGMVFHQFGRHLVDPSNEPIVDQNVLRAFYWYKDINQNELEDNTSKREERRKMKFGKDNLHKYLNWIEGRILMIDKTLREEFLSSVDKVLFSLGKVLRGK